MRHSRVAAFAAALLLPSFVCMAQERAPRAGLFSYPEAVPAADRWLDISSAEKEVQIRRQLLHRHGSATFPVTLLDGRTYEAVPTGVELRAADDLTWRGELRFEGHPEGTATLTLRRGRLAGILRTATGIYEVVPGAGGRHRLAAVDQRRTRPCGGSPAPPGVHVPTRASAEDIARTEGVVGRAAQAAPVIDVMVLYTPAARMTQSGAAEMEAKIQNAVDLTNDAYASSGISARIRLVFVGEIDHEETPEDMRVELDWLSTDPEIALLREVHGADLVALVVSQRAGGTAGIAWGMRKDSFGPLFAPLGFSVSSRTELTSGMTFAHELGHNLGCHHEPGHEQTPSPEEAPYPFSFAHLEANKFHTIMYSGDFGCGVFCTATPHFSNPDILVKELPAGILGERENFRTINNTAPYIAQFGDLPGELWFDPGIVTVEEGAGGLSIPVFRLNGSIGQISVGYSTADGSAVAGSDYEARSGTLTWATGESPYFFLEPTVHIPVVDDSAAEGNETFQVSLVDPGGGAGLGLTDSVLVTVLDDDVALGVCQESATAVCLQKDRFRVEVFWRDFAGSTGQAEAVGLTSDTAYFWFFKDSNVEVVLKVLNGSGINGRFWVFYGALSNVEYSIIVTDTQTGNRKVYHNPPGEFASVGDNEALPGDSTTAPVTASRRASAVSGPGDGIGAAAARSTAQCTADATHLCLNKGRFRVRVRWRDFEGNEGDGRAIALTGDTGYFWFFKDSNVELVLKVLDGTEVNGHFWVFYGALSNVEYTITVVDTETGDEKIYRNGAGEFASVGDTAAF